MLCRQGVQEGWQLAGLADGGEVGGQAIPACIPVGPADRLVQADGL